jgi:hypothetical protein
MQLLYSPATLSQVHAVGSVLRSMLLLIPPLPLLLPPPLLLLPSSLQAMYYDRKKQLIEQGKWFDDPDK